MSKPTCSVWPSCELSVALPAARMLCRSLRASSGLRRLAAARPAGSQLPYRHAVRQMQYSHDPYEQNARGGGHGDYRAWRGTTVLCVQRGDKAVMIADGQVSMGDVVFKSNVQKVRRFGGTDEEEGQIVAGFAGGTADALTLFERLEARLEEFPGQLTRAATSLARDWRTDKYLRRLEATMVVTDGSNAYLISGGGDVMNAEGGLIGIGSGGFYALAAARALATCEESSNLEIEEIAQRAMTVAADLCVYTNHNFVMLKTSAASDKTDDDDDDSDDKEE